MQKKKNIQLTLSLAVLLTLIVLFFVFTDQRSAPAVDPLIFQVPGLEKIDRIELSSAREKTVLTYNGSKWLVNGMEADQRTITVLFATLKQVEAKRPSATHVQDSLQKEITTRGTTISCYAGPALIKEFGVVGNPTSYETYFQLPGGVPYLVTIPGYRVFIASVFILTSNDWRDKRVFNFNWQNIKSLEVHFPSDPTQSFKASFKNGIFGIEGIVTDTTKLDGYMDALFQLRAEKILTYPKTSYDSLVKRSATEEITIEDIAGEHYALKLLLPERNQFSLLGFRNEELIELNKNVFPKIFRKKNYFIQKSR